MVKLKEIVTADDDDDEADDLREGGGIYMVFEFMDHDLTGLSESNQYGGGFPLRQIKCVSSLFFLFFVFLDLFLFLISFLKFDCFVLCVLNKFRISNKISSILCDIVFLNFRCVFNRL